MPHMTDPATRFQAAIALVDAERFADADAVCADLLTAAPGDAAVIFLRGLIAFHLADSSRSVTLIRDAIRLDPDNASFHATLGAILIECGARADAIAALERAVALQGDDLASLRHLARQLSLAGREGAAAAHWRRVIAIAAPDSGDLLALGDALEAIHDLDGALDVYRAAAALNPDNIAVQNHLGACHQKMGYLGDAISAYRISLNLQAEGNPAALGLFAAKQMACDWDDFALWRERADALTQNAIAADRAGAEDPFSHVTRCDDEAKNYAMAQQWSAALSARVAGWNITLDPSVRRDNGPIRIGYLSSDFHDHATAHLMAGLFAAHDRGRVVVHAYSCGPDDGSAYRRAIQDGCDSFIDIAALDAADGARRIRADKIDILIDLKGHTRHNRLEIAALRPAPLQVAWLGFPGTSGADFFDYIIADDIVTPTQSARFYSESLAVMPHCYQVNNNAQEIDTKPLSRIKLGLPENAVVLASFNNTYKYEPVMFAAWMDILDAVPDAVLWLQANNDLAMTNLRAAVAAADIDPARLIFAGFLPKAAHLQRLALADLALDTRIYNGHTTTSDALWAGLPVITLRGAHFASRVSASLLTAFGLPALIAETMDGYREVVISLARDPSRLAALRGDIKNRRATAPLFDTARFARDLERAYGEMCRRHHAGEAIRRLVVAQLRA
jgi:predicted O-linked N-acetylglucosamine transferase (SPINDLY family)